MSATANCDFARSVVDEWARAGISLAAVAPGSRSTPLAMALLADPRVRVEVVLDERSAAFLALGAAKVSGRPVVVLCTSGTAAANLAPAVIEAWHSRVPLIVCTADRPPELRDTGAGQATDQIKLFGSFVRWFVEVGAPTDTDDPAYWRSVAARAATTALGRPAGPVHLNLAFREPFVEVQTFPETESIPSAQSSGAEGDFDAVVSRLNEGGRADGRPWITSGRSGILASGDDVERLAAAVTGSRRGLLVAGWGADVDPAVAADFVRVTRWPVLADPLSNLRTGDAAVSAYDAFLRVPEVAARLQPDLVVHLGASPTGRVATEWLARVPRRLIVDPDGAWLDPHRSATDRIVADAEPLLRAVTYRLHQRSGGGAESRTAEPTDWAREWAAVEHSARVAADDLIETWPAPFEGRLARDLVGCLPAGTTLVVGSSMPVRDIEAFARPRAGIRFLSNRGVNGIDGFTSTVLGVASGMRPIPGLPADHAARGDPSPVVALCGDLTFLHDAGGLLGAARRGLDATIVVVDNDGGGIFSFLPQAGIEGFETLFGTPHHLDLVTLAAAHGLPARRVTLATDLVPTVTTAIDEGGVQIVIATTNRTDNVARHRQVNEAVRAALTPRPRPGG